MRYRAADPATLRVEPLGDGLHAIFHRASGITHLVTEPVPELLGALAEPAALPELLGRLSEKYELADPDPGALAARLAELAAAGLAQALPDAAPPAA